MLQCKLLCSTSYVGLSKEGPLLKVHYLLLWSNHCQKDNINQRVAKYFSDKVWRKLSLVVEKPNVDDLAVEKAERG